MIYHAEQLQGQCYLDSQEQSQSKQALANSLKPENRNPGKRRDKRTISNADQNHVHQTRMAHEFELSERQLKKQSKKEEKANI